MIGQNIAILVNGINLGCALQTFAPELSRDMLDNTTLCNTGSRTFLPGHKTGTISGEGIWDADSSDSSKIHDVMTEAFESGTALNITSSLESITQGSSAALMVESAKVENYTVKSELDQLVMASVQLRPDAIQYGLWIYKGSEDSDTDTGASVDNGAATTNGGLFQAHLYKQDDSTATSGTFSLEHSTNNSTWVELAADSVPTTFGAFGITIDAGTTIHRYTRVIFTSSGGIGYGAAALIRR